MTTDPGSGNGADQGENPVGQAAGAGADSDLQNEPAAGSEAGTAPTQAGTMSSQPGTTPSQPGTIPAQPGTTPAQDLSGWYQASDGQWYQHPGYAAGSEQPQAQYPQAQYPQADYAQPQYPQAQYPQGAYAQPSQYQQGQYPQDQTQYPQAQYPQAQYSQGNYPPGQYPPGQYPPAGYGSAGYRYVTPLGPKHNGMAIASLICAIGGIFFLGIPSILGIVFGFVARSQIERSNGGQTGSGLALAGIIVGFCVVALGILIVVLIAVGAHNCNTNNGFGSCN
jgi:hypothetical protein